MNILELDRLITCFEKEQKQGKDNTQILNFYYRKRLELKGRIIEKVLSQL